MLGVQLVWVLPVIGGIGPFKVTSCTSSTRPRRKTSSWQQSLKTLNSETQDGLLGIPQVISIRRVMQPSSVIK